MRGRAPGIATASRRIPARLGTTVASCQLSRVGRNRGNRYRRSPPPPRGEMGAGDQRELAAIVGETSNIAARIQQAAFPGTVVISGASQRLVRGFFTFQDSGPTSLNGISNPMRLYAVGGESGLESRFELALSGGLTRWLGEMKK
jgi:hypothetical protein